MANIRKIKRRIKAAKNISQITRAMQMVAASKMKKTQARAIESQAYSDKLYEITKEFSAKLKVSLEKFPLLRNDNLGNKILVIVISTNKGLCGGLNTTLFRFINGWLEKSPDIEFITLGKKAEHFILRSGRSLIADFSAFPFLESVGPIIKIVTDGYITKKYRQVFIIYNDFISVLKQTPAKKELMPIAGITKISELSGKEKEPEKETEKNPDNLSDFIIEPNTESILTTLLPHYLEIILRGAIYEAEASEHSARMMAMKSATDNALSFMSELTMEYNKARQQMITYEIADIVTAREAIRE